MNKDLELSVLEANDHETFIRLANKYLRDGWELYGNLIAFPQGEEQLSKRPVIRYIQAFTKVRKLENKITVATGSTDYEQ